MRNLLLLLGLVVTVLCQDLSPAPLQLLQMQYISAESSTRSPGHPPLRLVVKFVSPIDLIANKHTIVVTQTDLKSNFFSPWDSWTVFIPNVNRVFQNNTLVQPKIFGENKHEDLEDTRFCPAWDFNLISTVPVSALGAIAPRGRCLVTSDGKTIVCTLETPNGVISGVNTYSTGDYRIKAGVQYEMFIPQRFLSPNPGFPKQTLYTELLFFETAELTVDPDLSVGLSEAIDRRVVVVPLTYTVPELGLRTLLLRSAVPDNTIRGLKLNSLTLTFELGILVAAGGYLGIEANQNIFAEVPAAGVISTVSLGYNCGAFPELCCSASTVTTRPQGNGGVNPLVNPTPGWSQMRIKLGPKGCMLPKDKVIVLVLGSQLLGSNPSIADKWTIGDLTATTFQAGTAIAVNIRMFSSSEPHPVNVARLGEPRHPLLNCIAITPVSAGTNTALTTAAAGTAALFANALYWDCVAWASYVVGASTVKDFSAVPTSTSTNFNPGTVRFQFTLTTVNIANRSAATPNAVIITANAGVFAPNINNLGKPATVVGSKMQELAAGNLPATCVNIQWYTNAYGTLIILLNPFFNPQAQKQSAIDCANDLKEGTTVVVYIPSAAFLPNIPAGQWVYFDIRMVDPFMDNALQLYELYPTGGWFGPQITSVNTATLMMVQGWFTTNACSQGSGLNYSPNLLTNVRSLSVTERCEFIGWIASISPVTGGIYQCPTAATIAASAPYMVTFVKVPEAAFYGQNWPWSYTPNTPYPNPVSIPNTVEVTITNYGWIIDSPMFAVIVSYPPVAASVTALGVVPVVPATYVLLFIVRIDRLTESCQFLFVNPWEFLVVTNKNIVQCLFFPADGSNLAGTPLEHVTWGARHFHVPADGAVVCWTAAVGSPVPDDGSDDALFGLLALIAIPVLLCYCLLALLWFCRPKREPPCCVPEYPVQEMYWVNAQQPAPVYMVEQACAPATTPIYLVQ